MKKKNKTKTFFYLIDRVRAERRQTIDFQQVANVLYSILKKKKIQLNCIVYLICAHKFFCFELRVRAHTQVVPFFLYGVVWTSEHKSETMGREEKKKINVVKRLNDEQFEMVCFHQTCFLLFGCLSKQNDDCLVCIANHFCANGQGMCQVKELLAKLSCIR